MLKLGLTGGIASGKSVVAAILRELGFPVLDADSISHKLMEPGQAAHDEIVQSFGADLADSSGRIDRQKLAAIVFADPAKLAHLNAILHPRVDQIIFPSSKNGKKAGFTQLLSSKPRCSSKLACPQGSTVSWSPGARRNNNSNASALVA